MDAREMDTRGWTGGEEFLGDESLGRLATVARKVCSYRWWTRLYRRVLGGALLSLASEKRARPCWPSLAP